MSCENRAFAPRVESQSNLGSDINLDTVSTSHPEAYLASETDCARPSLSSEDKADLVASLESRRHRNQTSKDVFIGRLPPELLSNIFIIVTTSDKVDSKAQGRKPKCTRSAAVLAGVCYHWRQLATRTCQLWSHVDMSVGFDMSYLSLTKLWLERAGGALLDIHVSSGDTKSISEENAYHTLLSDRVAQFRSLHVVSLRSSFLASMVNFWLNSRNSRPLDELVFSHRLPENRRISMIGISSIKLPLQPSPSLATVRTLKLYGTSMDWDFVIFENLVELELYRVQPNRGLTARQLSQLLSACPELRSLYIDRVKIRAGASASPDIPPVNLDKLDRLTLGYLPKGGSARRLLGLLGSVSPSLCLRLYGTFCSQQEVVDDVIAFCNRVKILKICFDTCEGPVEAAAKIVVSVPSLETLVLDGVSLTQGFFDTMARSIEAPPYNPSIGKNPELSHDTSLQNLYIRECVVVPSKLCELVKARPIKHLEIWRCWWPDCFADIEYPPGSPYKEKLSVELRECLRNNVASFRYTEL